ncbi:MAG: ABC transporter substrate-binding protein [Rubritepida sp.]|nr:ABC transporter substrate-binding protein [Rubritepida sp.]
MRRLPAAIGRYPHTAALFDGRAPGPLDCADIPVISRAFAPMVREARYAVSEMAIATFLQALEHGKPLVLLPVALAGRFQEGALLCRADSGLTPATLAGARIGVRAYSQTTGMWLRGILASHGVAAETIRWTTFEDAHVPEYRDPPWASRAAAGHDMQAMLEAGGLDAAIFGNDTPASTALRPVFPHGAGEEFLRLHGFMPVNHLVVARADVADADTLQEVTRQLDAAAARAPSGLPRGRAALMPSLAFASHFCARQGLIARAPTYDEIWRGLPASIA